jgi:hypothetical protein
MATLQGRHPLQKRSLRVKLHHVLSGGKRRNSAISDRVAPFHKGPKGDNKCFWIILEPGTGRIIRPSGRRRKEIATALNIRGLPHPVSN